MNSLKLAGNNVVRAGKGNGAGKGYTPYSRTFIDFFFLCGHDTNANLVGTIIALCSQITGFSKCVCAIAGKLHIISYLGAIDKG